MPAISNFTRQKLVHATIDLDGETIEVDFDRNKVTPRWIDESQQRAANNDAHATSKMLADVIVQWDVTEDDGSPFPPIVDNLGQLPIHVQGELLRVIGQASVPGEAEGKALRAISPAVSEGSTATVTASQNGPPISTLPPASASLSPT